MDCKRALDEAGGDIEKAVQVLREKGIASAEKRAGRETGQGLVESYIHAGGRIGVIVEVNCETDFVARTDDFKKLAHDIAMQIAGVPERRSQSPKRTFRTMPRAQLGRDGAAQAALHPRRITTRSRRW